MKSIILRLILVLTAFAIAPDVLAADSGVYLAADLGRSHFSGTYFGSPFPPGWTRSESDGSAYRFTLGYQFTPYLGLEAGYVDLGHATATYTTTSGPLTLVSDRVEARGRFAALTATWPIDPQWSLVARFGGISGIFHEHVHQSNGVDGDVVADSVWTATYGLGVKWNFQPHWSLRLGWDYDHNLGDAGFGARLLSLGVEWRFF